MKLILKILLAGFMLFTSFSRLSYAQNLGDLVDQFKQATDLKRLDIQNDYFGKEIQATGIVTNVEEYNFFNEKNDLVKKYYRITTEEQKTPNSTSYQVIFLCKDLNSVKDIVKGQAITRTDRIVRISDERLNISVWLYDGEITQEEKELFAQ